MTNLVTISLMWAYTSQMEGVNTGYSRFRTAIGVAFGLYRQFSSDPIEGVRVVGVGYDQN